MHAKIQGHHVPLPEIGLDNFGWDKADVRGASVLSLYLDRMDLLVVGQTVYNYAQECVTEEPDYFEDENMEGIPVPESPEIFAGDPIRLATYLRDNFWRRETVLAILNASGIERRQIKYQIVDFKEVLKESNDIVSVHFGF